MLAYVSQTPMSGDHMTAFCSIEHVTAKLALQPPVGSPFLPFLLQQCRDLMLIWWHHAMMIAGSWICQMEEKTFWLAPKFVGWEINICSMKSLRLYLITTEPITLDTHGPEVLQSPPLIILFPVSFCFSFSPCPHLLKQLLRVFLGSTVCKPLF